MYLICTYELLYVIYMYLVLLRIYHASNPLSRTAKRAFPSRQYMITEYCTNLLKTIHLTDHYQLLLYVLLYIYIYVYIYIYIYIYI